MNSRVGMLAANAGLALISTLLGFLCIEVGYRMLGEQPQTVRVEDLDAPVSSSGRDTVAHRRPNRALYVRTATGKRLASNSRVLIRNHAVSKADVEIRTNSLGFRYRELEDKKATDLRILVLGDSITFSDYTAYDDTFTAIMEKTLNRHFREESEKRNAQVVNAGIGSVGLENELAILMETGLRVEPDVVLVALYLNDASESLYLEISRLPPVVEWSHFLGMVFRRIDFLRAQTLYRRASEDPAQQIVELLDEQKRLADRRERRRRGAQANEPDSDGPEAFASRLREIDARIRDLFRRHGSLFPAGHRIASELDAIDVRIAESRVASDGAGLSALRARRSRLMEDLRRMASSIRAHAISSHYEIERKAFIKNNEISKRPWKRSRSGFSRLIAEAFEDWGYAWSESCWDKIGHIMSIMKEVSEDHDFELAVALLPVKFQVQSGIHRDEPQQHFRELMSALQLEHLDLLPALRQAYADDGRDLYYDHCHYRPEGNELVGEEITRFLISNVL